MSHLTLVRLLGGTLLILSWLVASESQASDPIATSQINSGAPEGGDNSKDGISVAPVVGYDPAYGFVFGGAFFYQKDTFGFGTDFNLNFKQVYQLHLHLAHRFHEKWEYQLHSSTTKGFDPYFGEGGETDVNAFTHLWGVRSSESIKLLYHPAKILKVGTFANLRLRTEEPGETEPFVRHHPDETTPGFGLFSDLDTRTNTQDPKNGFRFVLDFTYVPGQLSSLPGLQDFGQIEGSFIVYKEILEEVIPDATAAFRLMGGYSIGHPTYMYRYALGGANQLHGYLDNRFRGEKYYLQQSELRFPIIKPVGGVLLLGFGDTTDTEFTNPKLSYGFGIRIGLPPDWISKLRIDFDFGRDQSTISANFGQTF